MRPRECHCPRCNLRLADARPGSLIEVVCRKCHALWRVSVDTRGVITYTSIEKKTLYSRR